MTLRIEPPYPPMEALLVDALPEGDEWQYEPKWDGFRCVAFRDGERIELPDDQIAALNASLKDPADCIDPVAVASTKGEAKPAGGHGAAPKEPEEPSAEEQAAKDAAASAEAAPAEEPPAKSGH